MIPPGVGVFVAFPMTEGMFVPAGIPEVTGNFLVFLFINGFQGIEITQGGVGFRASGQVEGGVGEVVLTLRKAYPVE